jgi:stage V sporulation protein R
MTKSRMMSGSPLLEGDNTIPGLKIHKEVNDLIPRIHEECKKMGLDYYPTIVEFVRYDEMSEIASYGGFPVRYPHWKWGMEYEQMAQGYEHNQYRISEMVINTNPCYIYCMDSNTLVDNVDVICHAIGHNDFFKNNVFFEPTDNNMMNKLANHSTRIRNYISRWGNEVVTEFIDQCLRVETLIDSRIAWSKKKIVNANLKDERKYRFPERLTSTHGYMDEWVNHKDFIEVQHEEIEKKEAADFLDIYGKPTRNIMGYLKDKAPLKPWQQDIITMLYEESMYFAPQRQTKMINEGWASFVDYHLLCREGLASLGQENEADGIWHYAEHKMRVLGGKYSMNPYKLGYEILLDIEDRWNKGKFGREWEECKDMQVKEDWDQKLGLGMDKVFDVRKHYNDYTLISEFFTRELCERKEFFEYRKFPNGEWKIINRDFDSIKANLLKKYLNGGLPDIRLTDPNHLGKGWFFLQHYADGRPLYDKYVREVLPSIYRLWRNVVVVATKNMDDTEFVYICDGPNPEKDIHVMERKDYEKEFIK